MYSYPIEKYRFITTKTKNGDPKVIAISTYAGKTVRGVAVCAPGDSFSLERGKELAAARCAYKIAQKRVARAQAKVNKAEDLLYQARCHADNMIDYLDNSVDAMWDAQDYLEDLLASM